MLFNSLQFLIFFPLVVGLYFGLPQRYRWMLLLAASYHFYMCWKVQYAALILLSTVIDYVAGLQIGKTQHKGLRRFWLLMSLITNLGLLFVFKYLDFSIDSLDTLFRYFHTAINIPEYKFLLPVGISFYTFQSLSYTIDVYRGAQAPEKHFGIFALYVSFFPQLVAGPIERSTRLLPQFYEKHDINYQRIADGLKQAAWGFFKKLVIADRVAVYVNTVYAAPGDFAAGQLAMATYLFAFQIYCDFSGYSDIAIGTAKVMGYELMTNFRRPYFASSISDFWKRWHISLSTWFRDYLYIALGGNRVGRLRHYFNLMAVFLVSGLWHGANWTFVVWGGLHGTYLVLSILTKRLRERIIRLLQLEQSTFILPLFRIVFVFHLSVFAWILFRAQHLAEALLIMGRLLTPAGWLMPTQPIGATFDFNIGLAGIVMLIVFDAMREKFDFKGRFRALPTGARWIAYAALLMVITLFGYNSGHDFIYFQF